MSEKNFDYKISGGDIVVSCENFDLSQTLDCGQAFRFAPGESGKWTGFAKNKKLTVFEKDGKFIFENTSEADFLGFWFDYFDFATDYSEVKKSFSADPVLSSAMKFGGGIRILRQDSFEALISFIMSQNNNIPRIKGMLTRFSEVYGGFPEPSDVANSDLKTLEPVRAGFRGKYILSAAKAVADGVVNLAELKTAPLEISRQNLMKISGVGPKVAECVLLYGCGRKECFPVDVWIKRVLEEFYPNGFMFSDSPFAGVAQQYLFYYVRNIKSNVNHPKVMIES
jgi:N-glycosylase/DNA lyase